MRIFLVSYIFAPENCFSVPRQRNGALALKMTPKFPDAQYMPLSSVDWKKRATNVMERFRWYRIIGLPSESAFVIRRSSEPMFGLIENTCCRCLRRAFEVPSHQCNAVFDDEGYMLRKCHNCAGAKKDCVSVGYHMCFAYGWPALTA